MLIQITILCAAFAAVVTVLIKFIIPDIAETCKEVYFEAEIEAARDELQQSEQDFNYAEPGYVDAAIYQLKAAEERYNTLIKEKKAG